VFTGADSALQPPLHSLSGVAFNAFLRYIHIRRLLDHVSHLESTVTGTLLVDNARIIQLLSFFIQDTACSRSFLSVFSVSFCLIGTH
jgi:hypothetical protein